MSALSDAYTAMAGAVDQAVSELNDLAGQVAQLEGEAAPITASLNALAQRLSDAYTPPAEVPAVDSPADETPAVDSPADEAPAVDSPADEAPVETG